MPGGTLELLWFPGWLLAVAVLFALALGIPLETRLGGAAAGARTCGLICAFVAAALLANAALSLHDVQIDLTREKVFTPAAAAVAVVDRLERPVKLTYFYHGDDPQGQRARHIVELMGRRNPMLEVDLVDPDTRPSRARSLGIEFYNAALLEAGGRRVLVRSTDENDIAIGIQRVLRERVVKLCFIEGHGEYTIENFEFHTHLEGFADHEHGGAGSAVTLTTGHGAGRLRRSLEALGYDVTAIAPAGTGLIPPDCAAVVDAGPRTGYAPVETAALEAYLQRGGALLLMYDLGFVPDPGLEQLMETLGVRLPGGIIIDPASHYGTDPEMVAVRAYDPHPITRDVSFTLFAGVGPIELVQPAPGIDTFALIRSSSGSHTQAIGPATQERPDVPAPAAHVVAAAIDGRLPAADSRPFRAVVIGDADFASNSFFPYVANSDLALAMVRWLVREEHNAPVAPRIPAPAPVVLTKTQMQAVFLIIEVLLPLGVIACGSVVWWRRR